MAKGRQMRFNKVGVRYCIEHDGIANEDDDECDFGRPDPRGLYEVKACKFRQLGYRTRS